MKRTLFAALAVLSLAIGSWQLLQADTTNAENCPPVCPPSQPCCCCE